MTEHCKDCSYWIRLNEETGECHCKAPLPYLHHPEVATRPKFAQWPLTKSEDICGEFKEKPHYGRTAGRPSR